MITENPFLGKKVLVVTAHPDDEAYFAGSLRQVVESGGEVRIACGTLGERGKSYMSREHTTDELKSIRLAELQAAAELIGVNQVYAGWFSDGELCERVVEFTARLTEVGNEYMPDIVVGFAADGYTGHVDHISASAAAQSTARALSAPYASFALPVEPYRTELLRLLEAKRKFGTYRESVIIAEPNVVLRVDVAFKMSVIDRHVSQLPGLNPYAVFGPSLGDHLMNFEYFCFGTE